MKSRYLIPLLITSANLLVTDCILAQQDNAAAPREVASAAVPKPHFRIEDDEVNVLSLWTKAKGMQVETHYIGPTSDRAYSGKQAIKLDVTLTGEHYVYFQIPINQRIEAGRSYYVSGRIYVERFPGRGRNKVGLGATPITWYGPGRTKNTEGGNLYDSVSAATDEWVLMESTDLGRNFPAHAASVGLPTDSIDIKNIFVGIQGQFEGERVTLYVDDVVLSRVARKPQRPVNVREFPVLDGLFPFGMYGMSGGFRSVDASGTFEDWFPEPLWRTISDFRRHHINTVIGGARQIYPDSEPHHWDELETLLDTLAAHGIGCMPIAYFSRYYRSDLDWPTVEASIRKQVPRFMDKKALLGWYIIDEPAATDAALDDYLRAKAIINEVDPQHPVTTGGNKYNIYLDRHRPVVIFDRYPLREHSRAPWSIANITHLIHRDANGPVWYIAPSFHNITGEYPRPTRAEFRLMCYAAVANGAKGLFFFNYRSRPGWFRSAHIGLVDVFEEESELWDETRKLGYHLTAVGPLLLNTELDKRQSVKVDAETIQIAWEERIPVISVSVLNDDAAGRRFLLVYNNDIEKPRSARIDLEAYKTGTDSLFDLYDLKPVHCDTSFTVELAPGDGRIYLLAAEDQIAACRKRILQHRFDHEKEMLSYELYFADLSGLASEDQRDLLRQADTAIKLAVVRETLKQSLAKGSAYQAMRDRLDTIRQRLSAINRLYDEKITSLESTARHPSAYIRREFDPSRPAVRAYIDALRDVGVCYFALRNLYVRGGYQALDEAVKDLDTLSQTLADNARSSFVGSGGVRQSAVPAEMLAELKRRATALKEAAPPVDFAISWQQWNNSQGN